MIQSTESICRGQLSPTSPASRWKIPMRQGVDQEPCQAADGKDHRKAEGSARTYAERGSGQELLPTPLHARSYRVVPSRKAKTIRSSEFW